MRRTAEPHSARGRAVGRSSVSARGAPAATPARGRRRRGGPAQVAVIVEAPSVAAATHAVVAVGGTVDLALPIVGGVAAHVAPARSRRSTRTRRCASSPTSTLHPTGASFRRGDRRPRRRHRRSRAIDPPAATGRRTPAAASRSRSSTPASPTRPTCTAAASCADPTSRARATASTTTATARSWPASSRATAPRARRGHASLRRRAGRDRRLGQGRRRRRLDDASRR